MKVEVRDNQIESALKALKKLMVKTGLFPEMKRREHYEKPSVKRKQAQARKTFRKAMKRAQLRDDE
jgi:small subunit ribosomal protein S21